MPITNEQITLYRTTFASFFSQLPGGNLRNFLNANGGSVSEPPEGLLADGALSWWEWNGGVGSYDGSNKYFATGMDGKRAWEWREECETAWDDDAAAFVNLCVPVEAEALALIAPNPSEDFTPAKTRIVLWNVPDYQTALGTHPDLDERENIIQPVDVYWGLGTSDPESVDVDTVANALAALPEGRRYIRLTDYFEPAGVDGLNGVRHRFAQTSNRGGLLRIYSPTTGRMCLYDQEFTHPYRAGLSQEVWRAQISNHDSNYRAFWRALRAKGDELFPSEGWKLLDGVMLDFESRNPYFYQQRGGSGVMEKRTISSVDTTADTITLNSAVDWETGDPVMFTTSNTLPSPLSTSVLYFVRKSSTTVFSVHTTAAGAIADTGRVNLASSGTGTHTVNHKHETLQNIIANDPNWEWIRTNLLLPVQSSATWRNGADLAGSPWTFSTDQRAFAFDAATRDSFTFNLRTAAQLILTDFGHEDLVLHEYDSSVLAPGTHTHSTAAHRNGHPFGTGNAAGVGTLAMYGDADNRWYWPTESYQSYSSLGADEKEWATVLEMAIAWRSIRSASSMDVVPWLSHLGIAGSGYNQWGADGLGDEFNLHALLGANEINFYVGSSDSDKTDAYLRIKQLAEEVDAVCQYRAGVMHPIAPIPSLEEAYLAHRVWRGNRWVWRITPNPTMAAPTIRNTATSLRIEFADASILSIRGGFVLDYEDELSPFGFWVEQLLTTYVPLATRSGGIMIPLGYRECLDLDSVVALTDAVFNDGESTGVPAGARLAAITAFESPVRWRDDGGDPSESEGMVLMPGDRLNYDGPLSRIRFIEELPGAELQVTYYKT